MLSIHVSLDHTHTGSGNVSTLTQWLPLCATHSFPSTLAPLWKSQGREILLPSLPKGFCRTGIWLHRGWQISQLSCQSFSDANLQGCSPWGKLLAQGVTLKQQNLLSPFIILNKRLWELLLEWVRIRIVLRQRQTFPLWRQYHQHITPPLVSRCGFRSLPHTALLAPGQALEENAPCAAGTQQLKDLGKNDCSHCAQGFLVCWGGEDGTDDSASP